MRYKEFREIPSLIRERLYLDECVDVNIEISEQFSFTEAQHKCFIEIENVILFKQDDPSNLPALLVQKLGIDRETAGKIAMELWGNYFLLFQDFLCPKDTTLSEQSESNGSTLRVDELIAKHGGNLAAYQERAKKLLSPGRQLRSFIREFLSDSPLEKASDDCAGEIVTALVERMTSDQSRQQFLDRVHAIILKENLPIEAGEHLVDNLEGMIATGTITKDWALYYRDLAANVLNAVPFVIPSEARNLQSDAQQNVDPSTKPALSERSESNGLGMTQGPLHSARDDDSFLRMRFEKLPDEKKNMFSSPAAIAARTELEKNFSIKLEEFLMRLAIGDFSEADLAFQLKKTFNLSPEKTSELRDQIMHAFFLQQPVIAKSEATKQSSRQALQTGLPRSARNDTAQDAPLQATSYKLPAKEDYDRIADIIIGGNTLSRLDEKLEPRVRQILVTRLKNIRSMVETKEKLMAPVAVGGAGLENDDSDALVRVATDVAEKILKGTYVIPESLGTHSMKLEAQEPEARSMKIEEQDIATQNLKLVTQKDAKAKQDIPASSFKLQASSSTPSLAIEEIDGLPVIVTKNLETKNLETRNVKLETSTQEDSRVSAQKKDVSNASSFKLQASSPAPQALIGAKMIPIAIRPAVADAPKQKTVADIKPKIVDAVEELRIMTLQDFRRLSNDPAEAIKRVFQKIQLLERESISKKMAAIDAWKENPVSTLYREMASMSMTGKKPLEGADALTDAEFDALIDLNELLRT